MSLPRSKLCALVFKPGRSVFDASVVVSMLVALFRAALELHNWLSSIQLLHSHQNAHAPQENIDSYLYCIFHINPATESVIIALPFNI